MILLDIVAWLERQLNRLYNWLLDIFDPEPPLPPPPPPKPLLWDKRLDDVGVTVERRDGLYELVAAWATVNGSWDDSPAWAWKWIDDTLGGDHNAFGRVEDKDGNAIVETFALTWGEGEGDTRQPEASGWANIPIYGGGGKYTWFVYGGDKLHNLTLPGNRHWSYFFVWRLR